MISLLAYSANYEYEHKYNPDERRRREISVPPTSSICDTLASELRYSCASHALSRGKGRKCFMLPVSPPLYS